MRKLVWIVVGILAFAYLILILVGFRYAESKSKIINCIWRIEAIAVNKKDVTDNFRRLSISFMENNELGLPKSWSYKSSPPIKYGEWKYQRRDFFNGQLIINDKNQGIFDGIYDIEILQHSKPQLVKLYSDSIDIYMREVLGFTDGKLSIPYYLHEGTYQDTSINRLVNLGDLTDSWIEGKRLFFWNCARCHNPHRMKKDFKEYLSEQSKLGKAVRLNNLKSLLNNPKHMGIELSNKKDSLSEIELNELLEFLEKPQR